MKFTVVIPARFASTRLPGKPLLDIGGQPMVQRVYNAACASNAATVIVATDDERIAEAVRAFGGQVCLTAASHESGTDRLEEVAQKLALDDDEILVNVQGDEPLIPPAVINQVAANLAQHPEASCATLSEPILRFDDVFNPNIVKVVKDAAGFALYFSRAPIPWDRDSYSHTAAQGAVNALAQRHIGIYAYRASLLRDFVHWPIAALEKCERLEQLRILANGRKIHVHEAVAPVPGGVDTPADLERVQQLLTKEI